MCAYYQEYKPKNPHHFRDMLDQFRKAEGDDDLKRIVVMWTLDSSVDRQDILVALGRVERERQGGAG